MGISPTWVCLTPKLVMILSATLAMNSLHHYVWSKCWETRKGHNPKGRAVFKANRETAQAQWNTTFLYYCCCCVCAWCDSWQQAWYVCGVERTRWSQFCLRGFGIQLRPASFPGRSLHLLIHLTDPQLSRLSFYPASVCPLGHPLRTLILEAAAAWTAAAEEKLPKAQESRESFLPSPVLPPCSLQRALKVDLRLSTDTATRV